MERKRKKKRGKYMQPEKLVALVQEQKRRIGEIFLPDETRNQSDGFVALDSRSNNMQSNHNSNGGICWKSREK